VTIQFSALGLHLAGKSMQIPVSMEVSGWKNMVKNIENPTRNGRLPDWMYHLIWENHLTIDEYHDLSMYFMNGSSIGATAFSRGLFVQRHGRFLRLLQTLRRHSVRIAGDLALCRAGGAGIVSDCDGCNMMQQYRLIQG